MTENFNALIREAIAKTPRKVYLPKLLENKIAERDVKLSYFTKNKTHKWIWAYKVCKALDIPGDIAYEALLADRGLSTGNIRALIKEAPDCFLCGYAFYGLRVQQLLLTVDESGEREKIVKEAHSLTTKAKKIITFFDDLELDSRQKAMLFLRFFELKTIKESAETLGYITRWALRLQQAGLKIVSESAEKYDK